MILREQASAKEFYIKITTICAKVSSDRLVCASESASYEARTHKQARGIVAAVMSDSQKSVSKVVVTSCEKSNL
jgi:hypothetical protein